MIAYCAIALLGKTAYRKTVNKQQNLRYANSAPPVGRQENGVQN